jgi:hypothetical protein
LCYFLWRSFIFGFSQFSKGFGSAFHLLMWLRVKAFDCISALLILSLFCDWFLSMLCRVDVAFMIVIICLFVLLCLLPVYDCDFIAIRLLNFICLAI